MTTPWRKAVRDFQQEGTRTAMVVLAIALGIAAFAAVLASYAVLTRTGGVAQPGALWGEGLQKHTREHAGAAARRMASGHRRNTH